MGVVGASPVDCCSRQQRRFIQGHNNRPEVLWLNLPAWKVGDRGFEHRSVVQVSKKQIVSSVLTRKYLILWGAFMTGR